MVIDVGEFDEQWHRVAGQHFSMHNTLFVPHDFAVSESYYIFFYSDTTFEMVSCSLPNGACIIQDLKTVWKQLCKLNRWCSGLHVYQLVSSHTRKNPVMQCILVCAATAADFAADYHRLLGCLPVAIDFLVFLSNAQLSHGLDQALCATTANVPIKLPFIPDHCLLLSPLVVFCCLTILPLTDVFQCYHLLRAVAKLQCHYQLSVSMQLRFDHCLLCLVCMSLLSFMDSLSSSVTSMLALTACAPGYTTMTDVCIDPQ